jgi:hypothetical protein
MGFIDAVFAALSRMCALRFTDQPTVSSRAMTSAGGDEGKGRRSSLPVIVEEDES